MNHNLSRRDMLKGTAAGAVGLVAGLAPAAASARAGCRHTALLGERGALDAGG